MKIRVAKFLTMIILASLLCVPAFANDEIVPYASDQFDMTNVDIAAQAGGKIVMDCKAYGTSRMTSIGMTKLTIYEKTGNAWFIVESRKLEDNPDWMVYNTYNFGTTEWYSGTVGKQYYVKATFEGTNSRGTDTRTYTSAVVTAHT